ncbi:MAG: DUF3828 domain-containing protein, partial [Pyrinomonadaceae bacterium]
MNNKTAKSILLTTILLLSFGRAFAESGEANVVGAQKIFNAQAANISHTFAAFAAAQLTAPDALIKDLYKVHGQNNDRILQGKSRTLLDKYFDKNLADLIWKDLTTHTDEVGVIDFDPFYNAQDMKIKNLLVARPKIVKGKATVAVSFTNFGKKELITYMLVKQKTTWKISDIKYK